MLIFKVTTDTWVFFPEKQIYFIFCNLLFHFNNNYIKQYKSNVTVRLFSYDSSKTRKIRPFSTKMLAEVRDKQAYDIEVDDYGILLIIASERFQFT